MLDKLITKLVIINDNNDKILFTFTRLIEIKRFFSSEVFTKPKQILYFNNSHFNIVEITFKPLVEKEEFNFEVHVHVSALIGKD